ncbi:Butanoate--CoA ligase AAE1 [Linum perenne]
MYELHFGVPMAGAVLCTLNTRHDSAMVSVLLNDEWDPITLNYTSGTTSSPKGVVYSHRGAYLNSLAAAFLNEMVSMPVYLWCVPMFHCNGWCLTWAVAAMGGTNIYFKNKEATEEAFKGGWLRSGDLGVKHPDGYIELKDRSKDIIISGGENISTIEVESVLFNHPAVLEAAIVGRPDEHWGEAVCAFVKLKEGCSATPKELIQYCRDHLPHYMAPRSVVFEDLPKTSTGKIQKYVLREKAKAMGGMSKQSNSKL